MKIFLIECGLFLNGKRITPTHLRPTGYAGPQSVSAAAVPEFQKILLSEEGGARTNQRHLTAKDIPKLR